MKQYKGEENPDEKLKNVFKIKVQESLRLVSDNALGVKSAVEAFGIPTAMKEINTDLDRSKLHDTLLPVENFSSKISVLLNDMKTFITQSEDQGSSFSDEDIEEANTVEEEITTLRAEISMLKNMFKEEADALNTGDYQKATQLKNAIKGRVVSGISGKVNRINDLVKSVFEEII